MAQTVVSQPEITTSHVPKGLVVVVVVTMPKMMPSWWHNEEGPELRKVSLLAQEQQGLSAAMREGRKTAHSLQKESMNGT